MPNTLNASFRAVGLDDGAAHPRGEKSAELLHEAVARGGWRVGPVECWRDSGYFFSCDRDAARLEIVLIAFEDDGRALQLTPAELPGFLGKALGRSPSASPTDVFALAQCVHQRLSEAPLLDPRWVWDDDPVKATATTPPAPA